MFSQLLFPLSQLILELSLALNNVTSNSQEPLGSHIVRSTIQSAVLAKVIGPSVNARVALPPYEVLTQQQLMLCSWLYFP